MYLVVTPNPMTKKLMLGFFLRCTAYCRQWISDYTKFAQPFTDTAHELGLTARDRMTWTPVSFEKLKEALASVPPSGIPDTSKDLSPEVDEKTSF